jgi:NTP pyrophosphatase (non-canonical NTP hydrolase)
MASFSQYQSIRHFQQVIKEIYGLPDDRLFSLENLLTNHERFSMRALKGIRKDNKRRQTSNLLIAFAWLIAIANRLHIDIEEDIWHRFPRLCSYCGHKPCVCKKEKIVNRIKIFRRNSQRPNRLADFQTMFDEIYPANDRTLADAGVHLAEEVGEVGETAHIYLGQHKQSQFDNVRLEMADWVSCMFGVANSADIDVAKGLEQMFQRGCHVCHKTPCVCNFSTVALYQS